MIERDPHHPELNLLEEKRNNVSANQNSVIALFVNIAYLLFDTLQLLLAPREMLRQIEEEADQQIDNSREH